MRAFAANAAWGAASLPAWSRFRSALSDPEAAQGRQLRRYLAANADTAFGRAHGFARMKTVADFQSGVPLSTWDDIVPWIDRIGAGETRVLTREPVRRLVPSSGSTAAAKLVPYTASLQREISEGVGAWVGGLFRRAPDLMRGRAYWSITPPAAPAQPVVESGRAVPVGFDDDSAYLGGVRGVLTRAVQAVPAGVRLGRDLGAFRRDTLVHLLRAADLRIASVWHPSFLAGLLDALEADWTETLDQLEATAPRRAAELRSLDPRAIRAIWPGLSLISCWADGPSRAAAADLGRRCEGVEMEGKGLLATEGVVTIPFDGAHPVAVTSHFLECLDPAGRPALVHQLETGVEYSVVLTTGGGLYRYHLADRVLVDGRVGATPSLRFLGKDDRVSDRVGEKLSDGFVANVIAAVFAGRAAPRFAMLAPEDRPSGTGVGYVLFVEVDGGDGEARGFADLAPALERELRRNPHYAWSVDLGQLHPATIALVRAGADQRYLDTCRSRGQKLGDIKPVSLHPATGWRNALS